MRYLPPRPLRGDDVVAGFSSGDAALDQWIARHAVPASQSNSARVYVVTLGDATGKVVAYTALAAGSVGPSEATARTRKGQPSHRPIPVAILARLAVDREHQRAGLGSALLRHAVVATLEASEQIGMRALIAHAKDVDAANWYRARGFESAVTDPLHVALLLKDARKLFT